MRAGPLLVLLAACLPNTRQSVATTRRSLGALVQTAPGALLVTSETFDGFVVVTARWPRDCVQQVTEHVENRDEPDPQPAGTTDGQAWGWFVTVPAMVIMWPIGLVTAVFSYAQSPSTKHETRVLDSLRSPCPMPAREIALHVTLASGRRIDGKTDERGRFAFVMPGAEPAGTIAVTSDVSLPPVERLEPPPPESQPSRPSLEAQRKTRGGLAGVGHAAMACAAQLQMSGVAKIELAIADNGAILEVNTDRDAALATCLRGGLTDVKFPLGSARVMTVPILLKKP